MLQVHVEFLVEPEGVHQTEGVEGPFLFELEFTVGKRIGTGLASILLILLLF